MAAFFSSLKRLEVYHLRNLLEAEGIPCILRNEALSQLAGEVPFTECALELWLKRDADIARAEQVFQDLQHGPRQSAHWRCDCGELLEDQFTACWKCGAIRI